MFAKKNTITSMVKPFPFIFLVCILSFISCRNLEAPDKKHEKPNGIFFDYKIRSQENDSTVSVYLLYRLGGPNGNTLKLTDPAKVAFDGETLPVDSAKLAGAFYDVEKPAASFAGRHTIDFTDFDSKEHTLEFNYKPFKLKTKIPATINRGDIVFDFSGLSNGDYVRVILADTSFQSRDIHEIDTIENNRLVIPAEKLAHLTNGPITLILAKEIERPINNGAGERGRLFISYGMQREFELKPPKSP
jgi:hypothetical protein